MKLQFKYIIALFGTILLFLLVFILGSDYITYRRNYKDFQAYMAEKQAQEAIGCEPPGSEQETQTEPENLNENLPETAEPQTVPADPDEALPGSNLITDVSGNVIWQAFGISGEEMESIYSYVAERQAVYELPNSYEKTIEIAEPDRKILDTAGCQFSGVTINFVGDSITEGVAGLEKPDGTHVSYVDYVLYYLGIE